MSTYPTVSTLSATDFPDDLKKAVISKTPEEIARDEKFRAFFSADIDLITRTIQADRQYRDKIDPHVIRRVNEQAHTMKWNEFWYYVVDLENNGSEMVIMYCNIFYKDAKIHGLLKKDRSLFKDTDYITLSNWLLSRLSNNASREGLFHGEDLP